MEFDFERCAAEDCDVVDVVFELVEEEFDEEPHPATEMERPTAANKASVLIMVSMNIRSCTPLPTIGALDLL